MIRLQLRILLIFIFTSQIDAKNYVEIGCFIDKENRAISGEPFHFATQVIQKCYEKATQMSNTLFAVQTIYCYTSPNANQTYYKYGVASGCKSGLGGYFMNSVYWIIDQESLTISDSLQELAPNLVPKWEKALAECIGTEKCTKAYNTGRVNMQRVGHGLAAGEKLTAAISGSLKAGTFDKVAKSLGNFAPYLGAFSPAMALVSLFWASDESQRINDVMGVVNTGFRRLEGEFQKLEYKLSDLERTIVSEHRITRITSILKEFSVANELVENYWDAEKKKNIKTRKERLVDGNVYNTLQAAIIWLYDDFTGKYLSSALCDSLIETTNVDRRQVMDTVIDLYRRMIQAVSNLVVIGSLKELSDLPETIKKETGRLEEIAEVIKKCDMEIESNRWVKQWMKDLERILDHPQKDKENELADKINSELSSKYYWRDWLIVVYRDMYGDDVHWRYHCNVDTYTYNGKHWKEMYNILISSVLKKAKKNDVRWGKVSNFEREEYKCHGRPNLNKDRKCYRNKYLGAKSTYKNFPRDVQKMQESCKIPISGVVIMKDTFTFALRAPESRKFYHQDSRRTCKINRFGNRCTTMKTHMFALG